MAGPGATAHAEGRHAAVPWDPHAWSQWTRWLLGGSGLDHPVDAPPGAEVCVGTSGGGEAGSTWPCGVLAGG